jgi:superoxide dismutase, Fe-Mn family
MERREFLKLSAGLGLVALIGGAGLGCQERRVPGIVLPPLPYAPDALEPYISARTIDIHYGKHHRGYVTRINALVAGTPYAGLPLTEVIRRTAKGKDDSALFDNAAQVFNHTFYWHSMRPGGGGLPVGRIAERIATSFGSYRNFFDTFSDAASSRFGSGWVWLAQDGPELQVLSTANADVPITRGLNPLLTLDVWEHAYYLDYQNRRVEYTRAFLEHLVNWEFAEKNLADRPGRPS